MQHIFPKLSIDETAQIDHTDHIAHCRVMNKRRRVVTTKARMQRARRRGWSIERVDLPTYRWFAENKDLNVFAKGQTRNEVLDKIEFFEQEEETANEV